MSSFIQKTYPQLNTTEYKVCLLSLLPISMEEIAKIIGLKIDSVKKARSVIRKKLEIEKGFTISRFIINEYYNRRKTVKKEEISRKEE